MRLIYAVIIAAAFTMCHPAQAQSVRQAIVQQTLPPQAVGPGVRNGLPPTNMDSFVYEAKEEKEHIYGDEGVTGLPPYNGFSKVHRINHGIFDRRDQGLTTGHGSWLPDAWGADEFLAPPEGEWDLSGTNGNNSMTGGPGWSGSGGSGDDYMAWVKEVLTRRGLWGSNDLNAMQQAVNEAHDGPGF